MTRLTTSLRPAPTARRPFAALVVSPEDSRRHALADLLEHSGARHVTSCGSGDDAQRRGRVDTCNDVCVLDGGTHDIPLLLLVRHLQSGGWRRIMMVSSRHDALGVRAALASGVRGYVVARNSWAAPEAARAPVGLTGREVEVLQAVADGRSNKEIGAYLGLSSLTVKSHMARISRKLGTGDRAELVAIAMRAGHVR